MYKIISFFLRLISPKYMFGADDAALAAIISGAISAAGSATMAGVQGGISANNLEFAIKQNQQNQLNYENQERENKQRYERTQDQYMNQVYYRARDLEHAGLSKTLAAGSTNTPISLANQSPMQQQAPQQSWDPSGLKDLLNSPGSALAMYKGTQDISQTQAQTDLTRATEKNNNRTTNANIEKIGAEKTKIEQETKELKHNLDWWKSTDMPTNAGHVGKELGLLSKVGAEIRKRISNPQQHGASGEW